MIPAVTVKSRPSGLPIATTPWPPPASPARPRGVIVAHRRDRQVRAVDLDHGDVGRRITADHLRLEGALVEEGDGDLVRVGDAVVVGRDVAVLRDDEAGATGFLRLPPRARGAGGWGGTP